MARLVKRGKSPHYTAQFMVKGIPYQRSTKTGDYQTALIRMGEMVKALRQSTESLDSQSSWGAFKIKYMEYSQRKKEHTHYRDKLAFRQLEQVFKPKELGEITPRKLKDVRDALRAEGLGAPAINRFLTAIKAAMHWAEDEEMMPMQNWRIAKALEHTPQTKTPYSLKDLRDMMLHAEGWRKTTIMLGSQAGLRRGESYWLEWPDILMDKEGVWVRPKPEYGWAPKDLEERIVPMTKSLKRYLQSLPRTSNFVLGASRPHSLDLYTNKFKDFLKAIGKHGNMHRLRHTFASHLGDANASDRHIADALGHGDTDLVQIYTHTSFEALKKAVAKLPPL